VAPTADPAVVDPVVVDSAVVDDPDTVPNCDADDEEDVDTP
jgi:hypothetical protein